MAAESSLPARTWTCWPSGKGASNRSPPKETGNWRRLDDSAHSAPTMAPLPHRANWFPNGSVTAKLKLPGETEAGSAGTRSCRGAARRAHRNDEVGACESGAAPLRQTFIGSKDPHALKIPARRAESYITKSASLHIPGSQDDLAQTSSKQLSCYTPATPRHHSLASVESTDLPDLPTDSPEEPFF